MATITPHYMANKSEESIPRMRIQSFGTLGRADRPKAFLVPPNAQDYRAMPNGGLSDHSADQLKVAQETIWKMSEEELATYADYVTRGSHFTMWYQKMFCMELLTRPDLNITAVGNIMFVKLYGLFDAIKRVAHMKADNWREAYHSKYLPACEGCLYEWCGQRDHMGDGGCLEDKWSDDDADNKPSDVRLVGMKRRARSLEREAPARKRKKVGGDVY